MHRFQAPHRLLIAVLLMAMLPLRAGLAWTPGEPTTGPAGDQPVSLQMAFHGDGGCCTDDGNAGEDQANRVCTATCACCAVLATAVTMPAGGAFPIPTASLLALVRNPQPVPLRPPRIIRS